MLIEIEIGDRYGDGHGMHDRFVYESNKTVEEIQKLYNKAEKIIGVDIVDLCQEYEACGISTDDVTLLNAAGINTSLLDEAYDEGFYFVTETYVDIYLQMVKVADPSFEYNLVTLSKIEIGGYGLFNR